MGVPVYKYSRMGTKTFSNYEDPYISLFREDLRCPKDTPPEKRLGHPLRASQSGAFFKGQRKLGLATVKKKLSSLKLHVGPWREAVLGRPTALA